jgi:hypothetical protein
MWLVTLLLLRGMLMLLLRLPLPFLPLVVEM